MNKEALTPNSTTQFTGSLAITSVVVMLIGTVFNGASGTDIWAALANGQMANYLEATDNVKSLLVANISFWIVGVFLMGVAGSLLAELCDARKGMAKMALGCYRVAVPLAIVAFLSMLAIVIQIAPNTSEYAVSIAEIVGWIATHADDLATALILGVAPCFLSISGVKTWMPIWLVRWGYLAGIMSILSFATIYFPKQYFLGLLILPVGLGWMIAIGVFLRKLK